MDYYKSFLVSEDTPESDLFYNKELKSYLFAKVISLNSSDRDKAIVLYYYLGDMSLSCIAKKMGISKSHVGNTLKKQLRILRRKISIDCRGDKLWG